MMTHLAGTMDISLQRITGLLPDKLQTVTEIQGEPLIPDLGSWQPMERRALQEKNTLVTFKLQLKKWHP